MAKISRSLRLPEHTHSTEYPSHGQKETRKIGSRQEEEQSRRLHSTYSGKEHFAYVYTLYTHTQIRRQAGSSILTYVTTVPSGAKRPGSINLLRQARDEREQILAYIDWQAGKTTSTLYNNVNTMYIYIWIERLQMAAPHALRTPQ